MAEYIEKSVALLSIEHEDPTFKYAIERVPAADVVEVVHSKWIKRNNERRCPICHYFYMTNGTTVYKYCPMCGAKMDGK